MARIRASRSPLDGPAWSWARSLRLFMLLLGRQSRVVPWQVAPATLALMAFAGLGARFFAVGWGATVVSRAFCSMVLAGVLLSVTMAFGDSRADMISSATPLGTGAVTLVRLVFILACDVVFGLMVTAVMGAQGYGTFGVLLVGWLSPLLLVAGVGAMLAIRFSTGVGFGVGLLLVAVIRTDLLGLTGLPAAGWIGYDPAIRAAAAGRHGSDGVRGGGGVLRTIVRGAHGGRGRLTGLKPTGLRRPFGVSREPCGCRPLPIR